MRRLQRRLSGPLVSFAQRNGSRMWPARPTAYTARSTRYKDSHHTTHAHTHSVALAYKKLGPTRARSPATGILPGRRHAPLLHHPHAPDANAAPAVANQPLARVSSKPYPASRTSSLLPAQRLLLIALVLPAEPPDAATSRAAIQCPPRARLRRPGWTSAPQPGAVPSRAEQLATEEVKSLARPHPHGDHMSDDNARCSGKASGDRIH